MVRRTVFILTATVLFFLSVGSAQEVEENTALEERIKPSCVKVIRYGSDGKEIGNGSGFFVSETRVITNRHVVEGAHSAGIKTFDGKIYPVSGVAAYDIAFDLVLLEVEVPLRKYSALSVSRFYPDTGEKIIVLGSPLGKWPRSVYGRVTGVYNLMMLGKVIDHSAPTQPGNSGSPVVTFSGYVIGINTWGWNKPGGSGRTGLAIPSEKIEELRPGMPQKLDEWNKEYKERKIGLEYFFRGADLFARMNYKAARKYLEMALEKDESLAQAWAMLGYCKQKEGLIEEAIEDYRTAVHHKINYAEAYYYMGVAYEYIGRLDKAVDALKDAILENREYKEAHLKLGLIYIELGKKKEALQQVEILQKLDPGMARTLYNYINK